MTTQVTTALAAFRETDLCKGLDADASAQLFALAEPVTFDQGERLVQQGDASRGAFVLRRGSAEARVSLPGGGEETVATLPAGSMFGEMALLDRGICSASVIATSPVTGWFIERDAFRALAAGRHPAALTIQRTITKGLMARLGGLNATLQRLPAPEDRPIETTPPANVFERLPRLPISGWALRPFLPVLPFFAGFTPTEIDAVIADAPVVELPRGEWLFAAGDTPLACYLVVRGALEVEVVREGIDGPSMRRMAVLGPGTLAGFMSVLAESPRSAYARAREAATLLEFRAPHFLRLYHGSSGADVKAQHAIHKSLLTSLARSNSQLSRLVTQQKLDAAVKVGVVGI